MSHLNPQTKERIRRLVNELSLTSLKGVELISKCQIVPIIGDYNLPHIILRIEIGLKMYKRFWFSSEKWVGFTECILAQDTAEHMRLYHLRRIAREVEEEVSQCVYEAVRERAAKSQFPQEKEYLSNFSNWFQFDPALLSESRYQKEALLKLAFFASRLKECAKLLDANPLGSRESYEDAFKAFQARLECLEHFNPRFAASIPHWSELPSFIEKWVEGQEVQSP